MGGSLKCSCMIMGEGEGIWPCEIVFKHILYIFIITTAFIHFHGFPEHLLPVVLLKLIMFFISGVSLIYINVNNC